MTSENSIKHKDRCFEEAQRTVETTPVASDFVSTFRRRRRGGTPFLLKHITHPETGGSDYCVRTESDYHKKKESGGILVGQDVSPGSRV